MPTWKIACAQIDCRLGDKRHNLDIIKARFYEAAQQGARLTIFPECALTGYCFSSRDEAMPHGEPLSGPASQELATLCRQLDSWIIVGFLEKTGNEDLFNACALIGPEGVLAGYRKIHLPFLGVDRFTTPGDRPFAVHDLGGLRVGMNICYDGSFPESSRVLTLLGADLVVLPTNWPTGAASTVKYLVQARALENHIYYAAANRVGEERGFHFIGQSRIVDCTGEFLAVSTIQTEEILYAEIDPEKSRNKRIVKIPGVYEIDRVANRRPEMYGLIANDKAYPSVNTS
jgi:5-aminopentanamidase